LQELGEIITNNIRRLLGGGKGSRYLRLPGILTKIELLRLEWPLAGDCLEVEGDSFC